LRHVCIRHPWLRRRHRGQWLRLRSSLRAAAAGSHQHTSRDSNASHFVKERLEPLPECSRVDRGRLGSIKLDTIRYQSPRWIGTAVRIALLARPAASVAAFREPFDSRSVSVAASSTARILRASKSGVYKDLMESSLRSLSDDDLHAAVRRLTARSNVTLADLLAHLGEVEERGIHRARACATLYAYCQYELRMSEDAAFRRAKAARLVHQHPELRGIVARGELHLTGLLMIAPYLGGPRHTEVIERARFRAKKEIARLIAEIDPKPEVPARIDPVAPAAPRRIPMHAIAQAFVGPVRSLPEGDRPADWIEPPPPANVGAASEVADPEQARELAEAEAALDRAWLAKQQAHPERPLRFRVQFTAEQEYVDLLEEAFDLLGLGKRAA